MDLLEALRDASHSVSESRHLLKTAFNKQWLVGLSNHKIARIRTSLLPNNALAARSDEIRPLVLPDLDRVLVSGHSTDTLPSPSVPDEIVICYGDAYGALSGGIAVVSSPLLTGAEDRTHSRDASEHQKFDLATRPATLGSILRNVAVESRDSLISTQRPKIDQTPETRVPCSVFGVANASGHQNLNPATRPTALPSILRNIAVDAEISFVLVCHSPFVCRT